MLTEYDTHDLASVRTCLEDVRTDLRTAQALLDAGRAVDLTGMDGRMAALCAQALGLPPPLARQTLPDLLALRDTVEVLVETLGRRPIR